EWDGLVRIAFWSNCWRRTTGYTAQRSQLTSASARRSTAFCRRLISTRRGPGPWISMTSWC
ncbi:hypothetical protein XENOCAPTIV_020389, partial [Xenoophorus captivus]